MYASLKWFSARKPGVARPKHRRPELGLLALEDRTVPSNVTVVPVGVTPDNVTTFATLAAALPAAGNGGVVTIEQGAPAIGNTSFPVVTQANLTIQGQPGAFASDLPGLTLEVNANGVTLKNLDLASVTFDGGIGNATVTRSAIGNLAFLGGSGSGHNTISANDITGMLSIDVPPTYGGGGGSGGVEPLGQYPSSGYAPGNTGDQVVNNTFTGTSLTMLHVTQDNNLVVQYNTFIGSGSNQITGVSGNTAVPGAPQTAMLIEASQGVMIANNTVRLPGDVVPAGTTGTFTALAIGEGTPYPEHGPDYGGPPVSPPPGNQQVSSGDILNNALNAGTTGIGLDLHSAALASNTDAQTKFVIQGNDFHDNAIGVRYTGSGGSTIGSDLGSANGSLGGNDFRSFTTPASATNAGIVLTGVGPGATLSAWRNAGASGSSGYAFVVQPSGGTATIDLTGPLPSNWAYVQSLYNNLLGRTGTLAEVVPWGNTYNNTGPTGAAVVTNGIASSDAALTWTIDSYYLRFLGRSAEAGGAQYWLNQIKAGLSLEGVQAGITSSQEFVNYTSSNYVQGLYQAFLGRTGSAVEVAYWQARLPAQGDHGVALGFAESAESKADFVQAAYTAYLHRAAAPAEVSYWQGQGAEFSILVGILSSTECVYST